MDKPYNRYVEDKIKVFMDLIFKYGYNDCELKPMLESILGAMHDDHNKKIITTYEYILTSTIIENLYLYAKRVCLDLRESENNDNDYMVGYNCGYTKAISDFSE